MEFSHFGLPCISRGINEIYASLYLDPMTEENYKIGEGVRETSLLMDAL